MTSCLLIFLRLISVGISLWDWQIVAKKMEKVNQNKINPRNETMDMHIYISTWVKLGLNMCFNIFF